MLYQAPTLRVFGDFRTLTRVGLSGSNDPATLVGGSGAGGCGSRPTPNDCARS